MTEQEMEGYRKQLVALGTRAHDDASGLVNEAFRKVGGEASGSLSNTPVHLADLGTDNFDQEMSMSLLENEQQTLQEISAALQRIEQKQYGSCEQCGKEISRPRLQALPYTRYCVECARQFETQGMEGANEHRL